MPKLRNLPVQYLCDAANFPQLTKLLRMDSWLNRGLWKLRQQERGGMGTTFTKNLPTPNKKKGVSNATLPNSQKLQDNLYLSNPDDVIGKTARIQKPDVISFVHIDHSKSFYLNTESWANFKKASKLVFMAARVCPFLPLLENILSSWH